MKILLPGLMFVLGYFYGLNDFGFPLVLFVLAVYIAIIVIVTAKPELK